MRALAIVTALLISSAAAEPSRAAIWPTAAERVAQELRSADVAVRRAAADRLSDLPAAAARRLASSALVDPDVEVRLRAVEVALSLSVPVADKVLPWLAESEPRLRLAAADALRRQPSARAIAQLGRALSDSDPAVRAAAARALGASESADAVLPLLGRLDDSVPEVRQEVVLALARLGDTRAVVPLIGKVEDARPSVRRAVARALGELADPRSVGGLVLALRDADDDVKVAALVALGRIGDAGAAPSIIALLESRPAPLVRAQALTALGKLGTPDALNVLLSELAVDEPGRERQPVVAAFERAGAPGRAMLLSCLRSPGQLESRDGCALALGASGDRASAPRIVSALERGAVTPAVGLLALGQLGERSVVPAVLEHLEASDPHVRSAARFAAGELLDPETPDGRAVDPLARALAAPRRMTADERLDLVRLLGRTGAPRAAPTLLPFASAATDPLLRQTAFEALGSIGPAGQDAVLLDALDDEHAGVRRAAALALRRVASARIAGELVRRLERAAEQDRRAIALALGGALSRSDDERVLGRVFRLLSKSRGPERDELIEALSRSRSQQALRSLTRLLGAGSIPADRAKVAEALAGNPRALPELRKLARDVDSAVRANALWAIGLLGDASDAELVRASLSDRDVAVSGNAAVGVGRIAGRTKSAPRGLCEALRDGRSYVRASALSGLRLSGRRCDPTLERRVLAQDSAEIVREAAARLIATVASEPADQRALARCAAEDPSGEVAQVCEKPLLEPPGGRAPLTVFVVPAGQAAPVPRAPFALVLADGSMRLGVSDRRGAVYEALAPGGAVELAVPAPLVR